MANQRYNGHNINLYKDISATTVPDWLLVACLTDLTYSGDADQIDANSKCGTATLAGDITETYDFTGFYEPSSDATKVSMHELSTQFKTRQSAHWKIEDDGTDPANPNTPQEPGTFVYEEFNGPLTTFNKTFSEGEAVGFDGTISVNGDIIYTAPTA